MINHLLQCSPREIWVSIQDNVEASLVDQVQAPRLCPRGLFEGVVAMEQRLQLGVY